MQQFEMCAFDCVQRRVAIFNPSPRKLRRNVDMQIRALSKLYMCHINQRRCEIRPTICVISCVTQRIF